MSADNLTIKQAARLLGIHHITLRRWIKSGKIKAAWEYEGEQGRRLISRAQVVELLEKQGKSVSESGQLERTGEDQIALSINKVNVYLKHLFRAEQESRSTELKNAIASLSVKLFISMGLVLIAGIAITLSIAYIAGIKQEANQKLLKGEMFKGFAYLKEGQKSGQEDLKTILTGELTRAREQIAILEARDQETKRELLEAARTANQAKTKEIQLLRDTVEAQSAGIRTMAEQMKAITAKLEEMNLERKEEPPSGPATIEEKPAPAATVPPEPEEEGSGYSDD